MNEYFQLGIDYNNEFAEITSWNGDHKFLELSLKGKIDIKTKNYELTGIIESNKKLIDVIRAIDTRWVISEKIREIIISTNYEGTHFQKINVELMKRNIIVRDYYIMSFIKRVDTGKVIDLEKSDIVFHTKKAKKNNDFSLIKRFKTLILNDRIDISLDIFRLKSPGITIISEKLKSRFQRNNIKGLDYKPLCVLGTSYNAPVREHK